MKTLKATSPEMTGPDVRAAQRALAKNPFGSFYRGEIDGIFGPLTAGASKDAKFWLGYEAASVVRGYGEALHEFLTGQAELTNPMKKRRASRQARPPAQKMREEALEIAISQIGTKESPANSNRVKYSQWYGVIGPWCAMFVTWCGEQAGLSAFDRGSRWAYCPYMVGDALEARNGLRARGRNEQPQPGDIVLYSWDGDLIAEHVGIYEKGTREDFTAIEGNTSPSNNSNGGAVMRRERDGVSVRLFAYAVR